MQPDRTMSDGERERERERELVMVWLSLSFLSLRLGLSALSRRRSAQQYTFCKTLYIHRRKAVRYID